MLSYRISYPWLATAHFSRILEERGGGDVDFLVTTKLDNSVMIY